MPVVQPSRLTNLGAPLFAPVLQHDMHLIALSFKRQCQDTRLSFARPPLIELPTLQPDSLVIADLLAGDNFCEQQIGGAQFGVGRCKQGIALGRHRRTASRAMLMASG